MLINFFYSIYETENNRTKYNDHLSILSSNYQLLQLLLFLNCQNTQSSFDFWVCTKKVNFNLYNGQCYLKNIKLLTLKRLFWSNHPLLHSSSHPTLKDYQSSQGYQLANQQPRPGNIKTKTVNYHIALIISISITH